jgi:predicted metal-dependent enzyme (double-stranded beta helix superfamily)
MDLLDQLIANCRDGASSATAGQHLVHEAVVEALADHERFRAALRARPQPWFFAADDLITVFATEGRPGSASSPHNHGLWSVLGCFAGAEESWSYRVVLNESVDVDDVTAIHQSVLRAGEVHALPDTAVHSVMNRWNTPNGMLHVYGGNFLAAERHIWDPVTNQRHPAGLAEPYAPLSTNQTFPADEIDSSEGRSAHLPAWPSPPGLAGTAFVALSAQDVESVATWLADTFGFTRFASAQDTCAIDEHFVYLVDPASLTAIGVHQRDEHSANGLDHVALRVTGIDALHDWHEALIRNDSNPSAITTWNFGTFVEVVGPEAIKVRMFVPERR